MSIIRALTIGALVAGGLAQPTLAQTYPSQNVTVIVAFPAGGLADIIGRLVSTKLEARLKHSVVASGRRKGQLLRGSLEITPTLDDEGRALSITLA